MFTILTVCSGAAIIIYVTTAGNIAKHYSLLTHHQRLRHKDCTEPASHMNYRAICYPQWKPNVFIDLTNFTMLSTRLTFLGILIDTDHQRLELPAENSRGWEPCLNHGFGARSTESVSYMYYPSWVTCTMQQLWSTPVGSLTIAKSKCLHHFIWLNEMMWGEFLPQWNGFRSFLPRTPTLTVTSDASMRLVYSC